MKVPGCCDPIPKLPTKLKPGDVIEVGEHHVCRMIDSDRWYQLTMSVRRCLMEGDCEKYDYYRDPRPFPVPNEPPKIEPPEWLGLVWNRAGIYVLVVWVASQRCGGVAPTGETYSAISPACWTLIEHPDYPASDELRALFEGSA